MTVTTNYLVTGNGITGSTANAVQALVSEAGNLAVATMGDSIAAVNFTYGLYFDARGAVNWALTFGGHQFDFQPTDQFAISGSNSVDMRNVQLPLIIAAMQAGRRYKYVWISIGTNDPGSGLTFAESVAAITTTCQKLRAYGVMPILRGISPRGNDGSLTTAKQGMLRLLAWMRTASLTGLCKLVDVGDIYADNATARFNGLAANLYADLLHPNQRGACMEGYLLYQQVFAKDPVAPMQFASSSADLFDRTLNPGGCLGTSAFHSGGTVSTAATTDPWYSAGAWTVTNRTLTNGVTRNDPTLTIAGAGGAATLHVDISQSSAAWAATAVQPGDLIESRALVKVTGAARVNTFSLAIGENDGAAEVQYGGLAKEGVDTSELILPDGLYWLRTPRTPIRAYTGPGSSVLRTYLKISAATGGGAAGVMQVMALEMRPVSL